jgi:predicted nucleotidyltransferase
MGITRYLDIEEKIGVPFSLIDLFCQRWKVTELALFGSVLRGDFRSDSDLRHRFPFEV